MTTHTMKKEIDALKKEIRKSKSTDNFSSGFQLYLDLQARQKEDYKNQLIKQERQQKKLEQRQRIKEQKLKLTDKWKSQKFKTQELKEELNKRDLIIKNLENRLMKLEKDAKKDVKKKETHKI